MGLREPLAHNFGGLIVTFSGAKSFFAFGPQNCFVIFADGCSIAKYCAESCRVLKALESGNIFFSISVDFKTRGAGHCLNSSVGCYTRRLREKPPGVAI